MPMKDILIAIIILLTLIAGFSTYGTPPEQDSAPPADTHGSGFKEPGESKEIERGEGDSPSIPKPTTPPDYTELALEVINGDWGNGYIRKQRLREAGHDAKAVQEIVNDILKEQK